MEEQQEFIEIKKFNPEDEIINNPQNEQNWPVIFHGLADQYANAQLIGPQRCGKSYLVKLIIKRQLKKIKHKTKEVINIFTGRKQKVQYTTGSQIYWISTLKTDSSTDELMTQYKVIRFDQSDIQNDVLITILQKLEERKQKIEGKKSNLKKNQYIRNLIVFDDIHLQMKYQMQLLTLLKMHRHFYLSIFSLSQDIVQQNIKMLRGTYNVQIFFTQINNGRLKDTIFHEQKGKISWDQFITMYEDATQKLYSFLCIDNRGIHALYQKKFDQYYILPGK